MIARSFDDDTALEPLGERLWRALVPQHWWIGTGPNGGWMAAVLTRAMMQATGRPPRSLTVHYMEAPTASPVEIAVTIEREGGSTTFTRLRMEQDGRPVVQALGVCAEWREGQVEWRDSEPPEVLPPDQAIRIDPDRTPVPEFWQNYDGRGVMGAPRQGEPTPAAGWIRTAQPHALDPVLVAALTDAWMPVAFVRSTERIVVPTIDLTIHWRAQLPVEGWALVVMRTSTAAGGVWEEDAEVWSEDGVLLAQARQLAIVRRPR